MAFSTSTSAARATFRPFAYLYAAHLVDPLGQAMQTF
jgi:hypothetical protein